MTSKTLKSAIWLILAVGATAMAAQGVPGGGGGGGGGGAGGGGGGGGGGGKPPTDATNSLSVPAIMAGGVGAFTGLVCGDGVFTPLGVPSTPDKAPKEYPASCATSKDGTTSCVAAGFYYVQRDAKWQAPCMKLAAGVTVFAQGAWGDNLEGSASLKVGSPIRVELVLLDASPLSAGQKGYKVIKLEPTELDRVSDFGHLATDVSGQWSPTAVDLGGIVYDPTARLKIEKVGGDGAPLSTVYDDVAGGEINATGKVVYGYSLRVKEAGAYRITYSFENVTITGCDAPKAVCGGDSARLDITVSGGGGGGKPPGTGEGE